MSEQKYDVFQVVNIIGTKRFQGVFTKAELGEIMDGAFYKGHEMNQDCVFLGCEEEWINPLIELIPVEED